MKRTIFILILFLCGLLVWAQSASEMSYPCLGTATTNLNVRMSPRQDAARSTTLRKGDQMVVKRMANASWGEIEYGEHHRKGYVHMNYVRLSPLPAPAATAPSPAKPSKKSYDAVEIFAALIGLVFLLAILAIVIKVIAAVGAIPLYLLWIAYRLVTWPFKALNGVQRYVAKPWLPLVKYAYFSDSTNRVLRQVAIYLKIPFYVLLFPVRFVSACYYNLMLHCLYEWFNYIMEVFNPKMENEGADDFWMWVGVFPIRVAKYIVWNGSLTLIESVIWTVIDTFLPALTLFHGTDYDAAGAILSSPDRSDRNYTDVSLWIVGKGNYAGNGIYFAPARSTALHYSKGVTIVCRVTLGKTLDLGLAPSWVYNACGYPNATEATAWGLKHGYVTGEWWRKDAGWWEYCMYDWQNRYNYSWRIRPLYVIRNDMGIVGRIPGGMHHWLFRELVLRDIATSIKEYFLSIFR